MGMDPHRLWEVKWLAHDCPASEQVESTFGLQTGGLAIGLLPCGTWEQENVLEPHSASASLPQHTPFPGAPGRSWSLPSLSWAWASRQHPSRSVFKAGLSWIWWRKRTWACQMSWPPPMSPALFTPNHSQPLTPDVSTTAKSIFLKNMIELLRKTSVVNAYEEGSIFKIASA